MKIIAVGWNYRGHNAEMNQKETPQNPIIFFKPETALLKDGKPFFLPQFSERIEYETELVFHISRLGKNKQAEARANGNPWDIAKGFDNSAPIGKFIPLPEQTPKADNINFSLFINGVKVQQGNSQDMIFHIDELIAYISQFYTLKIGDLIFTGTPAGVGLVKIGDHLEGYLEETKVLDFFVK